MKKVKSTKNHQEPMLNLTYTNSDEKYYLIGSDYQKELKSIISAAQDRSEFLLSLRGPQRMKYNNAIQENNRIGNELLVLLSSPVVVIYPSLLHAYIDTFALIMNTFWIYFPLKYQGQMSDCYLSMSRLLDLHNDMID